LAFVPLDIEGSDGQKWVWVIPGNAKTAGGRLLHRHITDKPNFGQHNRAFRSDQRCNTDFNALKVGLQSGDDNLQAFAFPFRRKQTHNALFAQRFALTDLFGSQLEHRRDSKNSVWSL
jgi:hypothetical protein